MIRYFLDFRQLVNDSLEGGAKSENNILLNLPKLKQEVMDHAYFIMVGLARNYAVNRRLHQMQRDTITLLDLLFKNQQDGNDNECCVLAKSCLLEILNYLHQSKYFDEGQRVPRLLIEEVGVGLKEQVTLIEAGMKKSKIDVKLQALILDPFLKFGAKQSDYRRMNYLLNLANKLIMLLQKTTCSEEDILHMLVQRSFNTKSFHHYYTKKMMEKLRIHYQVSAQLDELYNFEREFLRLPKSQKHCYNPFYDCCRSTFLKFVRIEIGYIERKKQLNTPQMAVQYPVQYRIKTTLSVDSFAYLLRLLIETEVVEAQPRTELMEFMAEHVQTCGKNERDISLNSLSTKYKQVTQRTAIGMRTLLLKMTKQVEENFNL